VKFHNHTYDASCTNDTSYSSLSTPTTVGRTSHEPPTSKKPGGDTPVKAS